MLSAESAGPVSEARAPLIRKRDRRACDQDDVGSVAMQRVGQN